MERSGFVSMPLTVWLTSSPGSPGQASAELALPGAPGRSHVMKSRTLWTPGQLGSFQMEGNNPSGPLPALVPWSHNWTFCRSLGQQILETLVPG